MVNACRYPLPGHASSEREAARACPWKPSALLLPSANLAVEQQEIPPGRQDFQCMKVLTCQAPVRGVSSYLALLENIVARQPSRSKGVFSTWEVSRLPVNQVVGSSLKYWGLCHALLSMWMACPDQDGTLQGQCGGSCNDLADDDAETGSGWQQNKQNCAVLSVVG